MGEQNQDFDVIVVGAGPAGSMAAWKLAQLGRRVLLLERGEYPGAKNLFGGMVYSVELAKHFPDFQKTAPLERPITRHATYLLSQDSSVNLDYSSSRLAKEPANGYAVLRSRFDRWLASKAVESGAVLITSTVAESAIVEDGHVVGVKVDREQGEIRAPLVIAADGILSRLGESAGLNQKRNPDHYSLGVREVLSLPARTIEERFQVDSNGGCAALFSGSWAGGIQGGGFIYTNRESLSVGFVAQLPSLIDGQASILDAFQDFKNHPTVRRLISGGERLEYGAHIVPEAGYNMRPTLVMNGMMLVGDAAGLVLAAGVMFEGVHYAMNSAVIAAEVADKALKQKDTSIKFLRAYQRKMARSYPVRNLKLFRKVPSVLANPRMYSVYPELACNIADDFFRAREAGHQKIWPILRKRLGVKGLIVFVIDNWRMARAFFF